MTPASRLPIEPGERVLDLCAAPGGKATELNARLSGTGLLVANDISNARAKALLRNLELFGSENVLVTNETPAGLADVFPGFFDKILVDAPCSGEGMFRKEEAAVNDWSDATVAMCAARQTEILSSAARMLKPGGRIVYSTCTFSPEENEGVVSRFLHEHPDFSVAEVKAPWFAPGRPDWISDPAEGLDRTFRLWPHRLRGEGHFAAVLSHDVRGGGETPAPQRAGNLPSPVRCFLEENGIRLPDGMPISFGETYFWAPRELPALDGLHVLRAGLELGEVRKGRFLPAHALALWLKEFPQSVALSAESAELAAYLRGETLRRPLAGWTLVRVDDYSLGWAYGADGVLKNHYPKGLRRKN